MIRICPSILNANLDDLPGEIAKIAAMADLLHLDVMDNVFVPNFTFSPERAIEIIELSSLPVDVHLMIADVDHTVNPYLDSKAASITIHFEASHNPRSTLNAIRGRGIRAGLAVKPATPFSVIEDLIDVVDMILVMTVEPGFGGQSFMADMMPKVEQAHRYLDQEGFNDRWLQVDGGISLETILVARMAGADTFVAGSAVYKSPDPGQMVERLKRAALEVNIQRS